MKRRGSPARFESRAALMEAAADFMAEALHEALDERGEACALLSGGSTPEPAYALLAARDIDWPCVTFGLVDERFVPPDDAASNERMLRRALAPALANGAALLPLFRPALDVCAAADEADAAYASLPLDLVMMGMGEDGHTASWFADAANFQDVVAENNPRTIVSTHAQSAAGSPDRLTLTFSAYKRAARVGLLITGQTKLDLALESYMHTNAAPVGYVWRNQGAFLQVLWAP